MLYLILKYSFSLTSPIRTLFPARPCSTRYIQPGHFANQVADGLIRDGIECTVLDPRTTSPLDTETILECVEETGRLVLVDEAHPRCNMATDISALVSQEAFAALKAPIVMVTPPHTPVPFSPDLEDRYIPNPAQIEAAVRRVMAP